MNFSISEAHRRYIDYHCYGNRLNTSKEDMAAIVHQYKDKLSQWQSSACDGDDNKYEFDDSDFTNWKADGKKNAQDKTGYEGNGWQKAGQITRGFVDGGGALGGLAVQTFGAGISGAAVKITGEKAMGKIAEKAGEKVAGKAAEKAAKVTSEKLAEGVTEEAAKLAGEKAGEEVTKKAGEEATKKVSDAAGNSAWIISTTLSLAEGIAYMAKKPNKEQKEACDELKNVMCESQAELASAQGMMEEMAVNLQDASEEAQQTNEAANDEIETGKAEYDLYAAIRKDLEAKVASGEQLTDNEKSLYETASKGMVESGEHINETQEETESTVGDIYDDMGTYQDGYDDTAETMGNIQGTTDYAESIDECTQVMCYVEMGAQTLNAASGAWGAFKAGQFALSGGWFTAWAWAFAAMGAAGAVMSGMGAWEQKDWAKEVGVEIDSRKGTQGLNGETMEIYDQEIDNYANMLGDVEDLELEIPDDTSAPDKMTIDVPETKTEDDPNKKKEDK